ncbi:hypothetical protein [Natronorubrum tibetense]|uniref:Uncharacterized protein n=1 Tax=Natronorubrum tibetense GA33 TaxID=1114856 RepID=L9VSD3_9EURY|nr:hypothetical protein [Natronorubrum tibetense]ELY40054.1 hypothetical protein C496_12904 [Natronorubrum tibetense GA33]
MVRNLVRHRPGRGPLLGATAAVAFATAAAIAYSRYRSRVESTTDEVRSVTERHAAAFLVDRRIDHDRVESVTDSVTETLVGHESTRLLRLEGASTASLFLESGGEDPLLRWYVEVPRTVVAEWSDPESTVVNAFPVTHDALSIPDESADRELLVHAVHPTRPRTIAADGSEPTTVIGPDEAAVDVGLVRLDLESGVSERFADRFAAVSRDVIAGELELGWIESWSRAVLEAEAMYTESIVLERGSDGYTAYQYMETADMEGVYDAYYDTWNPIARVSELLAGRIFEEPARILEYPIADDIELLAHAIDPERPRRVGGRLE